MKNEFINIYEPSGIVQFANDQVLIVEDDGAKPLCLLDINKDNPYDHLEEVHAFSLASIGVNDQELSRPGHYLYVAFHDLKFDSDYHKY